MTFKVGDRVRRVSDLSGPFKNKDTVWEVSHVGGKSLRVAGKDTWWLADKFMLVGERLNNDEWLRSYCNRYKNGQCQSLACLNRGGFTDGRPDYDLATCEAHEILTELAALRTNKPPAESSDDWVEITDPEHVLRDDDQLNGNFNLVDKHGIANSPGWVSVKTLGYGISGDKFHTRPNMRLRCRRCDLPVTAETEKITFHQVILDTFENRFLRWIEKPAADEIPTGETCVVEVPVKK